VNGFDLVPDGHGFILSGDLDVSHAAAFENALGEVLHVGGPVGVDMRRLRFMDSSGIKTIVAAAKAAPGTCIVLHGVHDEVQKIVEITGIEAMTNLHVMPCTVGLPG
jgi:anti-anti-sigma factor